MDREKDLKQYYKRISKQLNCSGNLKKQILTDLKLKINLFLEKNPQAGIEEIIAKFGDPHLFVEEYIKSMSELEINLNINRKGILKKGVFIACGIVLFIMVLVFAIMITINNNSKADYYVEGSPTKHSNDFREKGGSVLDFLKGP